MLIYLLASYYSLAGGPDWVLLMTCLSAASRELWAGAVPPLDCWDAAQTQHVNITYSCTMQLGKEGTLISGMNKHGRGRVSPELLYAKMELRLHLHD